MGDGFTYPQEFGPAPATLAADEISLTDERWTEYLTYPSTTTVWGTY